MLRPGTTTDMHLGNSKTLLVPGLLGECRSDKILDGVFEILNRLKETGRTRSQTMTRYRAGNVSPWERIWPLKWQDSHALFQVDFLKSFGSDRL